MGYNGVHTLPHKNPHNSCILPFFPKWRFEPGISAVSGATKMDKRHEVTSFGQWLSRQRKARDLTQEDLAERIGCSLWTIQKVEMGSRRPSKQVAELLADYLGIPPEGRVAFLQFARGQGDAWQQTSGEQTTRAEDHTLVAPTPRRPSPGGYPPNNLPTHLTSFVGRDAELPRLRDFMLTAEVRLLTLIGPPGTGKTRLALQVAAELLNDFDQGVFFVNLAPISDPGLVISEISQTLAVRESGGQSLLEELKGYLKDKQLLLVLDNFEHVVEAAPFVGDVLRAAPGVKTIVTSRVPLHIRGEKEFSVPSLQLPDIQHLPPIDRLTRYEAVRLFIERAADVRAGFEITNDNAATVAHICARLDGLPLAIELAAARVKFLSPESMLTRLGSRLELLTGGPRDLPARQRTLRNTIDWSHELLSEEEKKLFRRLAVFQGGRSLEAIEAICNAEGVPGIQVLDGVASLVDKGLLSQEEGVGGAPRFVMLETIHEFAREKLQESGEADALGKEHALYFMLLAEEVERHLSGGKQKEWLNRLNAEHDNTRHAFKWARGEAVRGTQYAVEIGLRLAGALWRFWQIRGDLTEGREVLEEALSWGGNPNSAVDGQSGMLKSARAKALHGAGVMAYGQGDVGTAQSLLEESLSLYKELGDKRGIAYVSTSMGHIPSIQGDTSKARSLYEDALAIFKALDDKQGIARTLSNLGDMAMTHGDYATARVFIEESVAIDRELGDKSSIANSLSTLGVVAMQEGKFAAARALYEEVLAIFRELDDRLALAQTLQHLGWLVQIQGDLPASRGLFEESLAMYRGLGHKQGTSASLTGLGILASDDGNYTEARSFYEQSLAIDRELKDKWGISTRLGNLGVLTMLEGKYAAARSYFTEGLEIAREVGAAMPIEWMLVNLGHASILDGDYPAAHSAYEEGLRLARKSGNIERIMLCLVGLGGAIGMGKEWREAEKGARLLGASDAVAEVFGIRLRVDDRIVYDHVTSSIRTQLGEEAFGRAKGEGRAMQLKEAIAYALRDWSAPTLHAGPHPTEAAGIGVTVTADAPVPGVAPNLPSSGELTEREGEVLRLMAQGLTSAKVAEQLYLSVWTVKAHLRSIYSKLGISTRSALTRYAIEHNLN